MPVASETEMLKGRRDGSRVHLPSALQVRRGGRQRRSSGRESSVARGSIRLPASLTQNLTSEQQQQATRVQFNFYQRSTVFQVRRSSCLPEINIYAQKFLTYFGFNNLAGQIKILTLCSGHCGLKRTDNLLFSETNRVCFNVLFSTGGRWRPG